MSSLESYKNTQSIFIKDYGVLFKINRKENFINTFDPVITKSCNLCCPHCWGDNGGSEFLSMENYEKILDLARYLNMNTIQYTGGEPLLHPKFLDFAKRSKDLYFDNSLRTNFATKILDEKTIIGILRYFDFVYISIDGTAECNFYLRPSVQFTRIKKSDPNKAKETFTKYAMENFNVIKTNLDNLVALKEKLNFKTKIVIASVIQRYNLDKIKDLLNFVNQYKNIRWDITQVTLDEVDINNITNDEFMKAIEEIMELSENIIKIKPKTYPRCLSADNQGNIMLSQQFNIKVGNYLENIDNNFELIKKAIHEAIKNKNNYDNYLYIPMKKIGNLFNFLN
ncbi:MAG TPA: radical SAM protein [Rickettsiales bacterium]|nr:radical SAM protein [Rickettsiales bacterium]